MSNTAKNQKNYEALAAKAPTQLHEDFAEWLFVKTGIKVDVKTVQLAVSFRMDFQASPENQKSLADRKAKAAQLKKSSAARKAAKLEAELAKLKGDKVEVEKSEGDKAYDAAFEKARALGGDHAEAADAGKRAKDAAEAPAEPVKLTVLYGNGEPEVHKFGCADLKKYTRAKGFSKETATVSSHTELTHLIYSDQIDGGESTLKDCYMGYDAKPCCPALDS